jgi:5-methylcytosine-specific restriction protein A
VCLLHPKSGSSRSLWAAFLFLEGIMSRGWRTQPLPPGWHKTRKRILERDEYRCYRCGADGCRRVDHIVPVSQGGGDEDSNLAAICDVCERSKTAREGNAAKPRRRREREPHPGRL